MNREMLDRTLKLLKTLFIVEWMVMLAGTNSMYSCYLVCGSMGIAAILSGAADGGKCLERRHTAVAIGACAVLFSLAVALANYDLISGAARCCMMLYGGYELGSALLWVLYRWMAAGDERAAERAKARGGAAQVFLLVWTACMCLNVSSLLLFHYPGVLSPDSVDQIGQILSGAYINHHPYWHTRLISVFFGLGLRLFGDCNAAVAVYSVAQMTMMALCFALAVMTLYQAGTKRSWLVGAAAAYILLPYHVMYSYTMWKDVLFGCAMLLLILALCRLLFGIGRRAVNHVLFVMGVLGTALLRSNGFLTLLAVFVLWVLFFARRQKAMTALFFAALSAAWIMLNPVLDGLGVGQANFREALSIPIQQVARVITLGGHVTQAQREQIDRVVEIEMVPQWYSPVISDPVKFKVDGEYIRQHKKEYLTLWIEIGLQNPGRYVEAWIEQTKGYWNGGYDYWIWNRGVTQNTYGIHARHDGLFADKFSALSLPKALAVFFSIGVHVWLLAGLFVVNCVLGRGKRAFLAVPVLVMVGTLLLATPVFSEFRYAYAVFTVLPFYAALSLTGKNAAA